MTTTISDTMTNIGHLDTIGFCSETFNTMDNLTGKYAFWEPCVISLIFRLKIIFYEIYEILRSFQMML